MMPKLQLVEHVPGLPVRATDGHKGTFGTVVVVGGCSTMIGAPALCATAALRGGAGLAKVACEQSILPFVLSIEPAATGIVLGDNATQLQKKLDEVDPKSAAVLAVGPGLGRGETAAAKVAAALAGSRVVVLDADGLNLLARSDLGRGRGDGPGLVMTPHPGEYTRLAQPLGIGKDPTDPIQRPDAAAQLAIAHRAVVVLKGHQTVVTDGRSVYTNTTGGPALATAGSGDVLTGLIAGLIAQGMANFEAAVLGVYLHGLAGDHWERDHGPSGMTARDLAGLLPWAVGSHRRLGRPGV